MQRAITIREPRRSQARHEQHRAHAAPGFFVQVLRHAELRDLHVPAAHQHAAAVVRTSTRNQLTCEKLIEMFEAYNRWESIFYFHGDVLPKTENKDHFKTSCGRPRWATCSKASHARTSTSSRSRPPSSTRCTRPATSCRPYQRVCDASTWSTTSRTTYSNNMLALKCIGASRAEGRPD